MNPPATPDRRSCSGIVLLTIALCSGCAPVDLLLLTMGSAGYCPHCLTVEVGQYGVSAENVAVLKGYRGRTVKIEQFTEAEPRRTEIICRGAVRITTPDKRPFDDYIRKAFIDELTAAELLSESAHVTLNGRANNVDFNSNIGEWLLDYTVMSSNGGSLRVAEKYGYGSAFIIRTACARTAEAFVPAVQALIGKLVQHPEFPELLR